MINKNILRIVLGQKNNIPPDKSQWPESWKIALHKTYERAATYILSKEDMGKARTTYSADIFDLLQKRRSAEGFSHNATIHLNELLFLLISAAGKNHPHKRVYGSGGAMYPVELYFINNNVPELEKGLYHFSAITGSLSQAKTLDFESLNALIGSYYAEMNHGAGLVVFSFNSYKNLHKYGWLGVRLGLIEVGEILQNISLVAESMGIKYRALGGGDYDSMNNVLEIDGISEGVVCLMCVGR